MIGFAARRFVAATAVLALVSFASFAFFASEFAPLKGSPILPAYWRWFQGIWSGRTLSQGLSGPIWPSLLPAFGHTAALLGLTVLVTVVLTLAVAAIATLAPRPIDAGLRLTLYVFWAVPPFLLALIVQQLVAASGSERGIGPLPIAGWPGTCPTGTGLDAGSYLPCPPAGEGATFIANVATHLTLPALALAATFIGLHGRYLRSALRLAISQQFALTATAKGLTSRRILLRHLLPFVAPTVVATFVADFGAIFGAALPIDWIFHLDGLGSLYISEVNPAHPTLDAYAAEALLLLSAATIIAFALIGEILVVALDPRSQRT